MKLLIATSNCGKYMEFAELLSLPGMKFCPLAEFSGRPPASEDGSTFADNARRKAEHYHHMTAMPVVADDSGLEVDALNGEPGVISARYAGAGASDRQNIDKLLMRLQGALGGQLRAEQSGREMAGAGRETPGMGQGTESGASHAGTISGKIVEESASEICAANSPPFSHRPPPTAHCPPTDIMPQTPGYALLSRARFVCALSLFAAGCEQFSTQGLCEGFITAHPRGDNGFGYDPVFFVPSQQRTMAELSSAMKNQISHRSVAARTLRRFLLQNPEILA